MKTKGLVGEQKGNPGQSNNQAIRAQIIEENVCHFSDWRES